MREPTAIVFGSLEGSNTATSMSLPPGGNGVWKLIPLYTARTSIGCAPTEGLSNLNCPCPSVLELATGCMPPCNCSKMTSTPATAFPVVPFFTVPCNTPACAETVPKHNVAKTARILFTGGHAPLPPHALRAACVRLLPSLDRSPRPPAPLRSPGKSSSLRSLLPSIFRSETQNADRADCQRWCRDAPSIDPISSDAARDRRRPAECRK